MSKPRDDAIVHYEDQAAEFAERYEQVLSSDVHAPFHDIVSAAAGLALDVGAGSGRDAAWLSGLGYEVVAAEPAAGMRREGASRHPGLGIRWIDDRLPDLSAVHRLGLAFDMILVSAVWMHIVPAQRARAFRKLVTLLKPGGALLMTLRQGPEDPERPMWGTSTGEIEALARSHGMNVVQVARAADQLGRPDVTWTSICLRMPNDGAGALPLLRGIILNDDKSSTYKLALLRSIARIADVAGIKFPQVGYGDEEIERLAIATGQEFETLRPIAPGLSVNTALGKTSSLLGHEVPTDCLVRVGRRVCPLCLIGAPDHKITWTLRFVRFCTKHGCRLIKACPACGEDLDWRVRAPDVCRCGHELYYHPAEDSISGADRDETIGPKYLADFLLGAQPNEIPMLSGLKFAEIFFAARRLGVFGAKRGDTFWLDDMMHDTVGIWLTRALRLLALDHGRFVDKLVSLSPKHQGMPTKKHLSVLAEVRTKLTESGAAEAPLVIALGEIVDRYPRVLA